MERNYTRVTKRCFTLVVFTFVGLYELETLGPTCLKLYLSLLFFFFFFVVASMARLLESQESQSRLIREYERTREKTASQAMNE